MTETELQKQILDYLKMQGLCVWRTNCGYVKKNVKLAPDGTPDIIGYLPDGKFLGIEVKLPGKELRPSQEKWLNTAKNNNCAVLVAYSVEDVERYLTDWI